ncbi:isochorismatase family cysteine hydrolase [Devosia sp. YIM 151766]|uniref:cysteine hydrolase family protein n=1 Tax=Devosia sp. YIM 151766 TaxID=3017325 RepID=UPI00255CC48E|nr:isochorismatase family cysteine hydrolase [Devosia sp. YIM 151766]WIY52480.1 isochorismatase family cysteine hydrolase [Devosia sp. YIM 151766]
MTNTKTALLVIDLQEANRPTGAWPVFDYSGIIDRSKTVIEAARATGIQVIYTRHWHAKDGSDLLRFEATGANGEPTHCIEGSDSAQISPEVAAKDGDIIVDKTRYSAFFGTRLEAVLQRLDIENLIVIGVWTEACVETTVNDAVWKGYKVTLVKDAMTTATQTMHKSAVLSMANWLYGGEIVTAKQAVRSMRGEAYEGWTFKDPSQFLFEADTIDQLYEQI